MTSCYCIGPQNGQPACPCQMKDVRIVGGRYTRTIDLGPAPQGDALDQACARWNQAQREACRRPDEVIVLKN